MDWGGGALFLPVTIHSKSPPSAPKGYTAEVTHKTIILPILVLRVFAIFVLRETGDAHIILSAVLSLRWKSRGSYEFAGERPVQCIGWPINQ